MLVSYAVIALLSALSASAAVTPIVPPGRSIDAIIDLNSDWQLKDTSKLIRRSGQATNLALNTFARNGLEARLHRAVPFAATDLHTVSSQHSLPLTSQPGWSDTRRLLNGILTPGRPNINVTQNSARVRVALDGQVYLAPITFGDQNFEVVIDTGSADTWLVTSNFKCLSVTSRAEVAQDACRFGPSYNTTGPFNKIPNLHFNISYADGEFLNGMMAKEKVTLGGVTVPDQTVGVVNYAAWNGDQLSSGLLGFGFPNITRAYLGEDPKADVRGNNVAYDPLFTSMHKRNLTAPVFSIALPRINVTSKAQINTGALALGGLPPAPVKYQPNFASVPIEYLSVAQTNGQSDKTAQYQLYTIMMEGVVYAPAGTNSTTVVDSRTVFGNAPSANWNASTSYKRGNVTRKARRTAPIQAIVDSGTTLVYLPRDVARTINSLWEPAAWLDKGSQTYMVPCNATGPRVGAQIDGKILWMDAEDQVLIVRGGETNQCFSAIQYSQDGVSLLGDAWMRSIVSVFDIGAGMMRFSPRLD